MKPKNTISNFNKSTEPDIHRFVEINLNIVEEIYAIMERKNITQKDLAQKLGKKESEISKWLTGMHNLTLRSIARLEVALGEDLILTSSKAKERMEEEVPVVKERKKGYK